MTPERIDARLDPRHSQDGRRRTYTLSPLDSHLPNDMHYGRIPAGKVQILEDIKLPNEAKLITETARPIIYHLYRKNGQSNTK